MSSIIQKKSTVKPFKIYPFPSRTTSQIPDALTTSEATAPLLFRLETYYNYRVNLARIGYNFVVVDIPK